jgi:hypothetical protein
MVSGALVALFYGIVAMLGGLSAVSFVLALRTPS